MNIVLDTNVLVSAVWSPGRNAGSILNAVFTRRFTPCYDHRILEEYDRVLHYRKFYEVAKFCHAILITGNGKHYPEEPDILTMSEFCERYL